MEQNGNEEMPRALCRMNCGFWASGMFDGMCSKCYKDSLKKPERPITPINPIATRGEASSTDVTAGVSSSLKFPATMETGTTSIVVPGPIETVNSSTAATPATIADGIASLSPLDKQNLSQPSPAKTGTCTSLTPSASAGSLSSRSRTPDLEEGASPKAAKAEQKKKSNRCHVCNKKVGLTGFTCRCEGLFCGLHRYSDKHGCQFDYKEHGAEEIRRNNPVVVGEKVAKI